MAHNIDTTLLRAFVGVAETGGMTRAGQLLNLTQAAVSQQVKRLEEQFQVRLFARDGRKVSLTNDGDRLLPMARRLLDMNDQVWGMMTASEFSGEVRVGVPHDIVRAFMPPILKSFNRAWPRVSVSLVPGASLGLLEDLARGDVDVTMATEPQVQPGGEVLLDDDLVWVGCRDGRAYTLEPLPITVGHRQCIFRTACLAALAETGREWRTVVDNGNMLSVYAAMEADLAVTALMASTVPDGMEVLSEEHGLPPLPPFKVTMYLPKTGASDIGREFAAHIRNEFAARYQSAA